MPALRLATVLGLVVCAAAPAPAQEPGRGSTSAIAPVIRAQLGAWDIEIAGQPRKCTVTLAPEPAAGGHALRMPATCRRALPILAGVAAWSVSAQGLPRLDDARGRPVLTFAEAGRGAIEAKAADGTSYAMQPKRRPRQAVQPAPQPSPAEQAALAATRPTRVDPATAPPEAELPGRYGLMRQPGREACRIVLKPAAAAQTRPAALEGLCADTGLQIFDPAAWRYADGRLVLIARKGHSVEFVPEKGLWRKDPAVGAPLLMRRLPD